MNHPVFYISALLLATSCMSPPTLAQISSPAHASTQKLATMDEAKWSREAIAEHQKTTQEAHNAMMEHIAHLSDHAADPAHKKLAKEIFPLHKDIHKTLTFDINASQAKNKAAHLQEMTNHLNNLSAHVDALHKTHTQHLSAVALGHPLHTLSKKYENLVDDLNAHKEMVQNHVENRMMHVKQPTP